MKSSALVGRKDLCRNLSMPWNPHTFERWIIQSGRFDGVVRKAFD
jgi:hypothetical protein